MTARRGCSVLVLLALLLGGCSTGRTDAGRDPASRPGCDPGGAEVDLGVPTIERPAYFTVSGGGELRLVVSGLPEGVIVGAVDEAAVWLGDGTTSPRADPEQPKRPLDSEQRVTASRDSPSTLRLGPGRHWLVVARPGRVEVIPCVGTDVGDVVASEPDPGEVFDLDR